jgi:hypothetical protein
MNVMKIVITVLISGLFSVMSINVFAQKGFDLDAGIGFYELTHVGMNWNYSAKSSVGLYMGTNFNLKEEQLRCIGLSYSHIYLKSLFWKIRPGFSIKPQYWTQDDENYTFSNMAFLFQGVLSYPVHDRLSLKLEGGGVFNSVLETDRKQNTTVGSPVRWNGNVSFSIHYKLTRSSNSL